MTEMEMASNIKRAEEIMRKGHLIAIECSDSNHGWAYWVYNGVLYSISAYDHHYDIWCAVGRLRAHCIHLEHVLGHKFFENSRDMLILDHDFVAQYC